MNIVIKWNIKTLLSDIPRLILTLLSIASTYALLTAIGLALCSFAADTGTLNEGLPKYIGLMGPPVVQFSFAATMYVLFAVSIAERKNQYHLMRSAGCTTRQFLQGFLLESFALDFAGGLPGIALGYLVAYVQLKAVDLPLDPAAYFSSANVLTGLLPVFLLVPLMLLLASVGLWVSPKQTRKRQPRKVRPPFRKRLFPGLFGAGGRLEYAFSKNERRHRWGVIFSVVANLSILFLLTAAISALSTTDPAYQSLPLNYVRVTCDKAIDENSYTDMETIVKQMQNEGLSDTFVLHYVLEPLVLQVRTDTLSFTQDHDRYAIGITIAGEPYVYHSFYRLDGERSLFLLRLSILDDTAFDRLATQIKLDPGGDRAIFMHTTGESIPQEDWQVNWECGPIDSLRVQTMPASLWQKIREKETAFEKAVVSAESWESMVEELGTPDFSVEAAKEELSGEHTKTVEIPVFCTSSTLSYSSPSLLLPARAATPYLASLLGGEVFSGHYTVTFYTDHPGTLAHKLKSAFEEKNYVVLEQKFGNNWNAESEQIRKVNASGGVAVFIEDDQSFYHTATLFMDQTEQFFFRYFTVAVFLSIALNIVNIVHMNRLSRRREYAILSSLGFSGRQRLGMSLYESFRFTVQTVFCGSIALVVLARILSPSASDAYSSERLSSSVEYNVEGWYKENAFLEQLWNTAQNLAISLKPYLDLILFTVAFLFLGYLITELLVNKKMDRDTLVPILKDDMHE